MSTRFRCGVFACLSTLFTILTIFASGSVAAANPSFVALPIGQQALKIELNADGIYQLTYTELQAAGLNVAAVDPQSIEMMWRGEPVAYQFDGDDDAQFEPHESILFYGWRFDGSRDEMQHVASNVFWLWADGAATQVQTVDNVIDRNGVEVVSAEIHTEPENTFSLTRSNDWGSFDNEFDAWYWDMLSKPAGAAVASSYTIELPHVAEGTNAELEIELLTQATGAHPLSIQVNDGMPQPHTIDGFVNKNLIQLVPSSQLKSGANSVTISLEAAGADKLYLNRITARYQRDLIVGNNELIFETGAANSVGLQNLSTSDSTQLLFWDISQRTQPIAINTANSFDSASGKHHVGTGQAERRIIATTQANLRTPDALSSYIAPELNPEEGADWVAIAHGSLLTETQRLAAHRQVHSRLQTQVVNVQDVINQYGYGLPLPAALQSYLQQAMSKWSTAPSYVLLVGDTTQNPRQLDCASCSGWDTSAVAMVPTFLKPLDRTMGLMPLDHFYSTLVGDDDRPDVALGRLPAENSAELSNMIDKILTYETNLVSAEAWMNNMLFISDNNDAAGPFCDYNDWHAGDYSDSFNKAQYCLDNSDINTLRQNMFEALNEGVLMAHYLGHGFINGWASEGILRNSDVDQLQNSGKPFIQISGNCLDAHFAWVGINGISETLLELEDAGTAAHWGATGLGYLIEHQLLHLEFTNALQTEGMTRIGDAIRHAKTAYLDYGYYAGQAYGSTLLGDPAMQIVHAELSVEQSADVTHVQADESVTFVTTVRNNGLQSTPVALTQTLPTDIVIESVATNLGTSTSLSDGTIELTVADLGWGETATLTVTARVTAAVTNKRMSFESTAVAQSEGFEANVLDNAASVRVSIGTAPTAVKMSGNSAETPQLPLLSLTLTLAVVSVGIHIQPNASQSFFGLAGRKVDFRRKLD